MHGRYEERHASYQGMPLDIPLVELKVPALAAESGWGFYFSAATRRCASDAASVAGFSFCTWS
jgi:hypothetical protein